jgi:hypothetical protein
VVPVRVDPECRLDVVELVFELTKHTPVSREVVRIVGSDRETVPLQIGGAGGQRIEIAWRRVRPDSDAPSKVISGM